MDLSTVLGIGQALAGGAGLLSAAEGNSATKQAKRNAQQQSEYAAEIADPNSAGFKNLAAADTQHAMNNYQQYLQQAINQNSLQKSMGRTPLFDPERGGENIYRALMLGGQDAYYQGQNNARSSLASAAGALGSATQSERGIGQDMTQRNLMPYAGAYQLAGGLGTALNGSQYGQQQQVSPDISWNGPRVSPQSYMPDPLYSQGVQG